MPQQFQTVQKLAPGLAQIDWNVSPEQVCQVMIETVGLRKERIWSLVESNQGQLEQEIGLLPLVTATLPAAGLAKLVELASVVKVWENTQVKVLAEEAEIPVYGGVWEGTYRFTGRGITVAVLDTGIAPHEDLVSPENRILAWNDLVNAQTTPYDDHGHGAHVAGLIAGNGRASHGLYKGAAPAARLAGIKVLDRTGCGRLSDLLLGIEWCLANRDILKIRVMNLSLGTRSQSNYYQDPLCRAAALAWKSGIVVCTAAAKVGRDYHNTDSPGGNERIITVGDSDWQKPLTVSDERLRQQGSHDATERNFVVPDLVAPGNNVIAIKRDNGYCTYRGASAAVPLVSGGVALLLERWPRLTPDQVKRLLLQTAVDVGLGRRLQGAGLLNLDRLLGGKTRPVAPTRHVPDQLSKLFLKGALNLLGKKATQVPLKANDILMLILPLLNQFINRKES